MSTLLQKFRSFFLPKYLAEKYASSKLQRRIQKHYGDSVGIQTQRGHEKSDIIFSSSITIADAI